MYYHYILKVWVVDVTDYFILSAFVGAVIAPRLKTYLSEQEAIERLKHSIIVKSKLVREHPKGRFSKLKDKRGIRRIYRFAVNLKNRGGQFVDLPVDEEIAVEVFKLAQIIQKVFEQLAVYLKERELQGIGKFFFKGGRLVLELILRNAQIDLNYALFTEELSTRMIVISLTTGGATGFVLAWFSAAASVILPPVLMSMLLIRSVAQQIVNARDYEQFKRLVNRMLDDSEMKKTLKATFMDQEVPAVPGLEMKPWGSTKNPLPDFNVDSGQTLDEFIKDRMKEELGLVENPNSDELKKLIKSKTSKVRPRGKTVYFRDFIRKLSEDPDDSIREEIVRKAVQIRIRNQEF